MSHKSNYIAIPLDTGTYGVGDLGNGKTASTVHTVYCLTDGNADITALGGGTFTWTATAGQSIDVQVGNFTVNSGTYVGFKEHFGSGRVHTSNIKF
jgi:hypothetical protein|tara:strand:- start:9151 stop:9438 length:288 start_codon:yes stop_codon:yes gene_type:complete